MFSLAAVARESRCCYFYALTIVSKRQFPDFLTLDWATSRRSKPTTHLYPICKE